MAIREYSDERGIPRRVLLPDNDTGNPKRGIPFSLNVDNLYPHMPVEFLQRLYPALWLRGIVTAEDALKPGAGALIAAAIMSIVQHDALTIQAVARGVYDGFDSDS